MTPVILSGGAGTRLWPVSRESYPKQFCDFFDKSLLESSLDRLRTFSSPLIVTTSGMQDLTRTAINAMQMQNIAMLLEPEAKNTAAAVAMTCLYLKRQGRGDEVIGIFPADHWISDINAFREAVSQAEEVAKANAICVLGIPPRYPSSAYGYIEMSEGMDNHNAFIVKKFHEKPSVEMAESYLKTGNYFWNAGIYIFKVSTMIRQFEQLQAAYWKTITQLDAEFTNIKEIYRKLPSVSIDVAIAEKSPSMKSISVEMGWSDVGSWEEMARLEQQEKSLQLNSKAKVIDAEAECSKNFVYSTEDKFVALLGVHNSYVVNTPDALLIAKRDHGPQLKNFVDRLKLQGIKESIHHPIVKRPWGEYRILEESALYLVKRVCVQPGHRLSYQSHQKCAETWAVIEGEGHAVLNDTEIHLKVGDHLHIPIGAKHRIANVSDKALVLIEIKTGDCLDEEDIIRYTDDYGRANT